MELRKRVAARKKGLVGCRLRDSSRALRRRAVWGELPERIMGCNIIVALSFGNMRGGRSANRPFKEIWVEKTGPRRLQAA